MVDRIQVREEWLAKAERADVIVFDLDGTLVDSDYANYLAYKDAVMSVLSTQIEIDFTLGTRITRDLLEELIPAITHKQLDEIALLKERLYHKFLSETETSPRLIEMVARVQDKEVVLATNSRRCRAEMLLNHHGLIEKFTRKIYRDAESQRDKYVQLMAELPKGSMSILVFENDKKAIESAVACGIGIDQIIDVSRIPR
ncbi:beta-phosphoglucomutase-like phosphatase (HAD superfamily) [Aliidiomarina maris]|nr:beta-phosphoglucomutase-like phosphatase (HAD superfamily) [Aliidiomarina maris]